MYAWRVDVGEALTVACRRRIPPLWRTLEQIAADLGVRTSTAWRCVNHTIEQLDVHAPSLTEALTGHHADDCMLLDYTLAEAHWVAAAGHFSEQSQPPDREYADYRQGRRKAAGDLPPAGAPTI
ncbi:hypothetical protein [Streptomyces sp. NPDC007205]|uniref:hypothetical protein n=1 Tax=Streptomyces sp. NPDC007205 TaxID=3154316 RepID=UPI0033E26595